MIPAITSAIVGNSVVKLLGVKHSHYKIPPVESVNLTNILKVIILAICFGLASRLFVYMTHWFKEKLIKYCKNQYLKIFVGGSLMVLATLIIGTNLYNNLSLGLLSDAFDGKVPYLAFIIKLILTTLCLGAGYQGGEDEERRRGFHDHRIRGNPPYAGYDEDVQHGWHGHGYVRRHGRDAGA